ncbi:hypothetical protein MD484_g4595, partial [Candolleomyces efflorescens]
MPATFTYTFDTPSYKGSSTLNAGLFINNEWVDPVDGDLIEVVNPGESFSNNMDLQRAAVLTSEVCRPPPRRRYPRSATGEAITKVAGGSKADVDKAVEAAKKAYKTTWGLKTPGKARGQLLFKLADLIEKNLDEFAALESLNAGKVYAKAKYADIGGAISVFRYYAGWADKITGKTIETNPTKFAYTRHEPYGVVVWQPLSFTYYEALLIARQGQIIPWNFPTSMLAWKIAPAVACGNTVVIKVAKPILTLDWQSLIRSHVQPSEITPLTALKLGEVVKEAGFPPGVINIVNGYGATVGQAIAEHPGIEKLAFTGSVLTGRRILKAAAETNLKDVSLELGGKSPTIIFDDADLEQAIKWAAGGIFAGSRIFVQEGVYDKFLEHFTAAAKSLGDGAGDPFAPGTQHGPQISQTQFDRIMSYIDSGKEAGARVEVGGVRHGDKGFFIKPTVFTDVTLDMKIVREEIFGPVGVVIKFKTEEEVIELANDTTYGLASHIFSENTSRAIRVAHALESGSVWVNCANSLEIAVPFGGYKQSGNGGRDLGEYALETYTQVKGVHINVGLKL